MPSCSTSSNISSAINALSVTQGGSRLIVSISSTTNPGLTAGNVIRYDVPTSGYTASKADDAARSEVFGVVESYDSTSNLYNVVIYGSVNLSSGSLASISGSTGACGGNDIYFLSGSTAGLLQNLAPSNLSHIVKPVYQAAPHGSYSGVVINYLGYRIGGDIESSLVDEELGNLQIVIGSNSFTDGYVDASTSHELPIADFSEFYSKFNTQFGYTEIITVGQSIGGGVAIGQQVIQDGNPLYAGTISFITPYTLYIKKSPGSPSAIITTNQSLKVDPTSPNSASFSVTQRSVYAAYSPRIVYNAPITTFDVNGSNVNLNTIGVGVKVKPQGVKVNIPSKVTVTDLVATTIAIGTGVTSDIGYVLNNHETRLALLEGKVF